MYRTAVALAIGCLVAMSGSVAASGGERPKENLLRAPRFSDSLPQLRYNIRKADNAIVTLETNFGKMVLELYRDVSPAHADSFLARCEDGFYSGTKFHRIIKDFMIQGGNPFLVGKQAVSYYLPNELNTLPHEFGTLSMASRGAPTTAQTQFFICTDRNTQTQSLDGKYVVFGHVLKGFDVLWAIDRVPVVAAKEFPGAEKSTPTKDVILQKAYRSDAEGNPLKK
ncbi:MAG: peptidylprolyl isomerase [candidate division Zixibacteria bacterium]|nr:peptidylprolyl isomerase [candidate division Zixibacteria bacterium]